MHTTACDIFQPLVQGVTQKHSASLLDHIKPILPRIHSTHARTRPHQPKTAQLVHGWNNGKMAKRTRVAWSRRPKLTNKPNTVFNNGTRPLSHSYSVPVYLHSSATYACRLGWSACQHIQTCTSRSPSVILVHCYQGWGGHGRATPLKFIYACCHEYS